MTYTIRTTNRGKFQVLQDGIAIHSGECSNTQEQAQEVIGRLLKFQEAEAIEESHRAPYRDKYTATLGLPHLRAMRQVIQEAYGNAAHESKLAAAAQRAVGYGVGQYSSIGRSIEGVRQGRADEMASDADLAWQKWAQASRQYETALQNELRAAGVPIGMFRSPVAEEVHA